MANGAALTYLVAGSALAAPQEALGGVLPTLQSLRVIVLGASFVCSVLNTKWPVSDA